MSSVDDAKAAVAAAQGALDTANTVLADIQGEIPVNSVTVTGITVHYSDGTTTEFALEDAGTGLPPTAEPAAGSTEDSAPGNSTESTTDSTPAADSGEPSATAPDAPAGTIPG
jgi:hypothetical protein